MNRKELIAEIDSLWMQFWTGGITNPLTVIEQISFLMFARLLDIMENRAENKLRRLGKQGAADVRPIFSPDQQDLRWQNFINLGAEKMLPHVRDKVFKHLRELAGDGATYGEYMKDAQLLIQKPTLLVNAVNAINRLPLTEGDTKGDLYEYLLSKLTTAGINGQFRTPRHVIQKMVEMVAPQPTELIADPACGTAGFLVAAIEYLRRTHSSAQGVLEEKDDDGTVTKVYTGDLLTPYMKHIQSGMFHGFDFDVTMLRIAAMNLLLHGIESPDIHYQDTLGNSFEERFPHAAKDGFDVILANPPFTGSLDDHSVARSLTIKVKTRKTELLFLALITRMLKLGGRAAVIVPSGVLFGSTKAHVGIRRMLIDENQLEGVIALPSGVFKPYAGVATGILVFTKGGKTDNVFFYDLVADGLSLDDKRQPVAENDLPEMLARWQTWKQSRGTETFADRKQKCFVVPHSEISANNYDLSVSRYREAVHEEQVFDPPAVILERLKALQNDIANDIGVMEGMLK